MLIVKLPFPAAELFPNRKNGRHWASTSQAKSNNKMDGWANTRIALYTAGPQEWPEHIPLYLLYMTPDKRHRDADNMLAASKALIDGMAEALGVNDKRFKPVTVDWVHHEKPGALIASIGAEIVSIA